MTIGRVLSVAARGGAMAVAFALAATPCEAVPQPHPRIWLDAAAITRMQAARDANTAEWQSLKNWCDANLGDNLSEGYQYLDWYMYTLNYGLAYRVTGNAAYGNEGVVYLTAMLRDRYAIGDGLVGTNAIQIDSGYVSRSLGAGVAMGRDWLDGAPNLTPALITECTKRMDEWMTWIHRPETYGIGEPTTNYHAGHFAMTYSAFIAFEGDPGYQTDWETKSEAMWDDVADMFNTELDGGDWAEGWNYGPRAMRHLLGYPWALETGTDRPDHWDEIDITSEVVRAQVSMLHPARDLMSDDGRWSGDTKGDPRTATCLMMSVLSDTDATAKGLAVWYANNLNWNGTPDRWERVLFTDPSIAPIAPSVATIGGLTWKMWGHSVTRSADWTDLDATFVDVVAWTHAAEEHNFGEVKIASRRKPLLVDGQTWQLEAEYANVPLIAGTHTYAPYQEVWHEPAVMTVDSMDGVYAYHKMANMDYCYNGVNDDNPSCSYFQRDVVFIAPDHVIVRDHIAATSLANTIAEQWHVMGNPTLSGDTAVVTNGTARMYMRTVSPATTMTETDTDSSREGTYRLNVAVTTPSIQNHVLTLFETCASTAAAMTPNALISASGFTGINVTDPAAPKIALFGTAEDAQNTSCSFSYVPSAQNTRVVIVGMQPSTNFAVAVTPGSGGAFDVSVTPGAGYASAVNGSLTFVASTATSGVGDWSAYGD